jgi:hypothetical protein
MSMDCSDAAAAAAASSCRNCGCVGGEKAGNLGSANARNDFEAASEREREKRERKGGRKQLSDRKNKCNARAPFFKRMYLSNTEPLTSLNCPLNAVFHILRGPVPQDSGTRLLLILQIFNLSIISIAVLKSVPPMQGYRKETLFPH